MFKKRTSFDSESFPAAVCLALTDDFQLDGGEFWTHALNACELAKSTKDPALCAEGIRQLRKRIQSPNHLLVMKGLLLVESLVKNCSTTHIRFVSYIAEEKFMRSMVKLVTRAGKKGGRDNLEASDKVLDLLQSWGETFVNHPEKDQVRLFIAHYHELRLKGVRFPHESTAQSTGVMTPSKRPSQPKNQPTHQQEGSGGSTANDAGSNKLQTVTGLSDEYTIVSSTLELISQALDHVTTPQELESNDIVIDLMAQINSVHGKIRSDLEAALLSNSPLLTGLLALNDNIHATIRRRENILTGQVVQPHPEGEGVGEEGGSDGGSSSGEEEQQKEIIAPASLVVTNSVVPTLIGPVSGGRSRGRSGQSPSLKPADSNDLDDLLGLGLGMADQVPQSPQVPQSLQPPQPPLRQNSDGFGGLMRADSGWSDFSSEGGAGDTITPMVASSVSSTTTPPPPSNGLGDLASLYSNSSQSNRNGMNGGMGNNRMQPGVVGLMPGPSHMNNNNMNNNNGAGGSGGGNMMNGRMGNGGGMGNNRMQPGMMGLMSGPSNMNSNNGGGGMTMNGGGIHNNGMSGGMNNGMMMQQQRTTGMIPTPPTTTPTTPTPSTLQERPRSGSNPFDQFNPFAAVTNEASPQVEENKKRRPSNPFDNL